MNQIEIYIGKDNQTHVEVRFENETVWLSQKQMAELFDKTIMTVNEHINNIYQDGELDENSTIRKSLIVQKEGKRSVTREVLFYSLDIIISVGYRVKSKRGTQFRLWATQRLKDYLIKGYAINQKRFSLEGGEAVIPAINALMEHGANLGIQDYVIGMAHRGRLNVLTNIMNKTYKDVFTEFEGRPSEDSLFDGDVKYHMGYSSDQLSDEGKNVHISLTPNPSHLETSAAVVQGIIRSKIDSRHNGDNTKACAISLHGDAAVAGQGLVYELVQMSQFAFRWVFCLLIREFSLKITVRLFDTYISDEGGFEVLHVYICAAVILKFGAKIKKMSNNEIMTFLQSLPTRFWGEEELKILIAEAYVYKSIFEKSIGHLKI